MCVSVRTNQGFFYTLLDSSSGEDCIDGDAQVWIVSLDTRGGCLFFDSTPRTLTRVDSPFDTLDLYYTFLHTVLFCSLWLLFGSLQLMRHYLVVDCRTLCLPRSRYRRVSRRIGLVSDYLVPNRRCGPAHCALAVLYRRVRASNSKWSQRNRLVRISRVRRSHLSLDNFLAN